MSLDVVKTGMLLNEASKVYIGSQGTSNEGFLPKMSEILDNGFQEAVCSLSNFDITIPKGSFKLVNTERDKFALHIGQECGRYWSECIGLGIPIERVVVSVVNDASKIILPIAKNIMNINRESTSSPYDVFVECIYKEIKTIKWVITCLDSVGNKVVYNGTVL